MFKDLITRAERLDRGSRGDWYALLAFVSALVLGVFIGNLLDVTWCIECVDINSAK